MWRRWAPACAGVTSRYKQPGACLCAPDCPHALLCRPAAIDRDRDPGDLRGRRARQEGGEFAHLLGRWRDEGVRETRFMLGAADGHSDAERASAALLLAFGPATWPHLMARAMLMEQLYRATTILAGHPYHRA